MQCLRGHPNAPSPGARSLGKPTTVQSGTLRRSLGREVTGPPRRRSGDARQGPAPAGPGLRAGDPGGRKQGWSSWPWGWWGGLHPPGVRRLWTQDTAQPIPARHRPRWCAECKVEGALCPWLEGWAEEQESHASRRCPAWGAFPHKPGPKQWGQWQRALSSWLWTSHDRDHLPLPCAKNLGQLHTQPTHNTT